MSLNGQTLTPAARRFTMAAFWAGILVLISLSTTGRAQSSLTLAWNPSPDSSVVGYRFYRGCASRTYTNSVDVGNTTSYTATGLKAGVTYYFAVTAYDQSRLESLFSDEVSYTVPASNPPVMITSCRKLASGNFSLSGTGAASKTHVLLAASSLTGPVWAPVATNTADAQGLFNCTDLRSTNFLRRFYRIEVR